MRQPIFKKDDLITCTNGHIVGRVVRDVGLGDLDWGAAFDWQQEDAPVPGSMYAPKCEKCGAPFIESPSWRVHIAGWRP